MQNATDSLPYQFPTSSIPSVNQSAETQDRVYLVDDDAIHRDFIKRLCDSAGLETTCFSSASAFLVDAAELPSGCLLLDMMMPGMDGLALFQHIAEQKLPMTSVLMTGFADTTSCRAAFRAGMFDFVDKDRPPMEILETIKLAIAHNKKSKQQASEPCVADYQWDVLTERESEVAHLLMEGDTLKQIASQLQISVQTASKHRSRVFEKTNVNSEVELLKVTMAKSQAA
ncbi:Response regulator protein TmoT [Rubripirellula obstinata]|uniref:Response regulator protein TmoT n=1 Tax=Rubripirellula obstinata TaxID=406547 RepID=A0A5B1CQK6_9BACT|nr:response regulator [Rubripirellula obstinata]KAA1261673.1 Response regulator protein TmoT [Rubripirellula obstinata]